eukprot:jgi/Hompol1/6217/HPOL_002216-RA
MFNELEQAYMREALSLANEAYDVGEVPVGCVFVHDTDGIIGRGRNRTNETLNGTRHAEFEAIDQILEQRPKDTPLDTYITSTFEQTDLFVTVEPCVMCASALRKIGIRRVVYGCGNDKFGGCGSVFCVNTELRGFDYSKLINRSRFSADQHSCDCTSNGSRDVNDGKGYEAVGGLFREEAVMALRRFYVRENDHAPVPKKKTNRVLKTDFN